MYPRADVLALIGPIRVDGAPPAANEETRRFRSWLAEHGAPEIAQWNTALETVAVRGGYHGTLSAAQVMTCADAISVDDGVIAARIRSLFLGVSPILEDAEDLWLARWQPMPDGTSQVWRSHQDERQFWKVSDAITDFVVVQYGEDPYFGGSHADQRVTWPAAWGAQPALTCDDGGVPGEVLGMDALQERTDWILALWRPDVDWYGFGDGLATAPGFSAFVEEAAAIQRWPHVQAYWLWHHLVFDNREALAALVDRVERRYPPCEELATIAEHVLAGTPFGSPLWNAHAIHGLRASALAEHPRVFEPAARARLEDGDAGGRALDDAMAAELEVLGDAAAMPAWRLLEAGAGRLDAHEADGIRAMVRDPDEQTATLLRAKRGEAPMLGRALQALARDSDAAWRPLAEAALARSATFDDGHARHHPGTLTALVIAIGNWREASARIVLALGPLDGLGRWRRLALAAAAEPLWQRGDAAALAFLRDEAKRYAAQLPTTATDTAALAIERLLARRDAQTIEVVVAAIDKAHGTRLMPLLAPILAEPDPAFAPILAAVVRRGVGRHADGDPVVHAVALGKSDPALARKVLVGHEAASLSGRVAVVAGLLAADPGDAAAGQAAREVLALLDSTKEGECGAAIALLRAARTLEAPGFDETIASWKARPRSKHIGAPLRRWIEAA